MCCLANTWLRGVTPLNAYTLTQTRTHTHTHSLVKPCLVILPGKVTLCVETPRGVDTHSPTTLRTPSSLSSRAACEPFYLHVSREDTQMCVLERTQHTHTHTGSCVYRSGAVTRGCAVYLSFFPLFESITCFFIFFRLIKMKLLDFETRRKEECFQRLPPTVLRLLCRAGSCRPSRGGVALVPAQTSASSKTLE